MKIDCYIWADGAHFFIDAFYDGLTESKKGRIVKSKGIVKGVLADDRRFWTSHTHELSSIDFMNEFVTFLDFYTDVIALAKEWKAERIVAEVLTRYKRNGQNGGFYFTNEIIRKISQLGIGVDIPIWIDVDDDRLDLMPE